jgi:Lysyl-tRNA synthetase (class I)
MKFISQKDCENLKAWPFIEALKIIDRFGGIKNFKTPEKDYILFETGYGPSGLPHIGTFGEVVRTSMVRHALSKIIDCKTKLFTFSDDMDGLRKIPDNIPNKEKTY